MKIYDFSDAAYLNKDEKLIINMNTALLAFHTEENILAFRNTHLNWLLLYDLKLDDQDHMHARMAYDAYGDIVSISPFINDEALENIMTIADYCHGEVLMDICHCSNPEKHTERACRAGVKYIIGCHHTGMITCSYEKIFTNAWNEEDI